MSGIVSNAYNFSESISSGVDVRTGMFSFSVNLGTFISHKGSGPTVDLSLNYNASGIYDTGFGRGWGISLSSFSQSTNTLMLSSGQSFKIQWNNEKGEYDIPYRKLKDIRVFYLGVSNEIQVVYKDGRKDFIDWDEGTLNKTVSNQGLAIYFDYSTFNFKPTLWRIYDDAGRETVINWWDSTWTTRVKHSFNNTVYQELVFNKTGNGVYKRLDDIRFPEHTYSTKIAYRYLTICDYDLIETVTHASGMIEEITYLDNGHLLPDNAPLDRIPYVTVHQISPGENQLTQYTTYDYSDKNYLGFASDRAWVAGEDTLFKAANNYQFSCTETINSRQSVVRIYNKYHLLESAEYLNNGILYKKEQNLYFADLNSSIDYQAANYSFVKEQKVTYYKNGASKTYTTCFNYDEYANQTYVKQVDGSEVQRVFYAASGEGNACPAEPNNMVALLKRESFIPAITQHGETPRHTQMTYQALPKLDDVNDYIVLLSNTTDDNQSTTQTYYRDNTNVYQYGRIHTSVTVINGKQSQLTYAYDFAADGLLTTQNILAHDGISASISEKTSYLDGQPIESTNIDNVKMLFTYDSIGRKLSETVAPSTEYSASVHYHYEVGSGINALTITDVKGNQQVRQFNNAGKDTNTQQTDSHGVLRNISTLHYDAFGLLITQTNTDWLADIPLSLTTAYEYDEHGEVNKITHPDGRIELITQNQVTLTTEYNIVGLLKEITLYNESGLETSKQTLDVDNNQLAKTLYHYDGYANLLDTTDTNHHLTSQRYDNCDRVVAIDREIDNQTLTQTLQYADFTTGELATDIKMNNISLGHRQYDGLARMVQEESGTVTRSFQYVGSSMLPSTQTTPHGDTVTFNNNQYLQVPLSMTMAANADLASTYDYDKTTGSLKQTLNQSGLQGFDHNRLGQLTSESVQLNDGTTRSAHYDYSLMGLLLSKEDYFGNVTRYNYDRYARIQTVVSTENGQSTTTDIIYDVHSRPVQYDTHHNDDIVSIALVPNAMGMETSRIVTVNGIEEFTTTQTFNTDLQIKEKIYREGTDITTETMTYDELHRLDTYTCSGPNAPQDEYGNVITHQSFQYDVYGNITQADSTFVGGTNNSTLFTYALDNPVQLKNMTNTHPSYHADVNFEYDAAGNLLSDEQGREYQYNSLDQMETVSQDGNTLSRYHYDASGQVVSQTNDDALIYLYYQGEQLANEFSEGVHTSYQRVGSAAVSRTVNAQGSAQHQFLLPNAQGSILTTLTETETSDERTKQTRQYTPYGQG